MTTREIVEVIAAILVFGGSYFTARFTATGAVKAADTTREVGMATVDASREDRFIERLEGRLQAVETEAAANADRVEEQRRVIYAMQDRIVALERARVRDHELIERLRGFIIEVLQKWPQPGQPVPPPPLPPIGLLDGEH